MCAHVRLQIWRVDFQGMGSRSESRELLPPTDDNLLILKRNLPDVISLPHRGGVGYIGADKVGQIMSQTENQDASVNSGISSLVCEGFIHECNGAGSINRLQIL